MPWGRLDDQANASPKLLALTDPAWRMWGAGLIYCQNALTDGFIPDHAIHAFGVRAPNKLKVAMELCSVLVPGKGPLWHKVDDGYQIHDYLDWNDSREKVLGERAKALERLNRHKGRNRNGVVNAVLNAVSNAFRAPHSSALETRSELSLEPRSERLSTYHVPQELEKQERADAAVRFADSAENQQNSIRLHRRHRSKETDDGRPALRVIAALARDVVRTQPASTDDFELRELLKSACAKANLRYDATSVGEALEIARAQCRKSAAS